MRSFFEKAFASQTRDEWEHVFLNTDSCVAPVLEPGEAHAQKGTAIPHPAPHLSRTPAKVPTSKLQQQLLAAGDHTISVLRELGLSEKEILALKDNADIEVFERVKSKL